MNLLSGLYDVVATGCDRYREVSDPTYVQTKENLNQIRQTGSLVALAALVTSVFVSILGLSFGFSGGILLIALPTMYLSYNAYKVCENLKDIIDTPYKYRRALTEGVNESKIRTQLLKETFFFEPVFDLALQAIREGAV